MARKGIVLITALSLLLLLLLPACLAAVERRLLVESRSEDTGVNSLQLVCQMRSSTSTNSVWVNDTTAQFIWNQGDDLQGVLDAQTPPVGHSVSRNGAGIIFELTPAVEGQFSCRGASGLESLPRTLVVWPDNRLRIPPPPRTFARLGDTVRLHCLVPPGRERDQYHATWNINTLFLISQDRRLSPRYSMTDNFTLVIADVRFNESALNYHCVVTVVDPLEGELTYSRTQSVDISLTVLDAENVSVIEDSTVLLSGDEAHSTNYTCSKAIFGGSISTSLVWSHSGQRINQQDQRKYTISSSSSLSQKRVGPTMVDVYTSYSYLTVNDITPFDSGMIRCDATPSTTVVQPSFAETTLNVLSNRFNRSDIIITKRGEVRFELVLLAPIPATVSMLIRLVNADDAGMQEVVTSGFTNADQLFFSLVPRFPRFRSQSALMIGSLQGPFYPEDLSNSQIHDVSKPNCTRLSDSSIRLIATVSAAAVALIVIVLVVFVALCCCCKYKFVDHEKVCGKSKVDLLKAKGEYEKKVIDEFKDEATRKEVLFKMWDQSLRHQDPPDGPNDRMDLDSGTTARKEITEEEKRKYRVVLRVMMEGLNHSELNTDVVHLTKGTVTKWRRFRRPNA